MPHKPLRATQAWATHRSKSLADAVEELNKAEDYLDEFKQRFNGILDASAGAAIDDMLELCTEIAKAGNPSLSYTMEEVDMCRKAMDELRKTEQSRAMAETCIGCCTWLTDELWTQVSAFARNLTKCTETIRGKKEESPETELKDELAQLQKMIVDNSMPPRGEGVFSSNAFTIVSTSTPDGQILWDFFHRLGKVQTLVDNIRKYLGKMARHIVNRYFPDR